MRGCMRGRGDTREGGADEPGRALFNIRIGMDASYVALRWSPTVRRGPRLDTPGILPVGGVQAPPVGERDVGERDVANL